MAEVVGIRFKEAPLGTELVGIDCCSFHFRYLYHKENTLVFLEEVEAVPVIVEIPF